MQSIGVGAACLSGCLQLRNDGTSDVCHVVYRLHNHPVHSPAQPNKAFEQQLSTLSVQWRSNGEHGVLCDVQTYKNLLLFAATCLHKPYAKCAFTIYGDAKRLTETLLGERVS